MASTTDVVTRSKVLALLDSNPKAVERALTVLHARQTSDEQNTRDSKHRNSRGFSAPDAPLMSKFAEDLKRYGSLTGPKIRRCRIRLRGYWRQLLESAEEKGHKVSYNPKL